MNRRTQIIVAAAAALILIATLVTTLIFQPQPAQNTEQTVTPTAEQTVTVTLPQGVTAEILNVTEDAHGTETNTENTSVATLQSSQEVKLKPGTYTIISKATSDYKESSQQFTVIDQPVSIEVAPVYTEAKLQSALSAERSAILSAITATYPQLESLYTIETGWLYEKGDWYATKLIHKSGGNQGDTLRLVAQKQADGWKIITNPPDITVSQAKYPDIPEAVVTDINNFR